LEITTDDLEKLDTMFQDNSAASVRSCEFEIQKILGRLDIGESLTIGDIGLQLKTIDDFKTFVYKNYSFGHLDFVDLLKQWRDD
jgi:hypothetical protein